MYRANQSAHPMQVLRETTTALEASILLCLAKPRKRAVHELRTATRRVEAQLELLSLLPGPPLHDEQRREALRLLKEVRHAAGQVRDIDVQRDLIRDEASGDQQAPRPDAELRKEARRLRSALSRKRDEKADRLLRLLHKQSAHLPLVFEELLDTLAPVNSITLTEAKLTSLVLKRYGRDHEVPASEDTAQLHEIRKRAKLARYLAESAPESAIAARRLAKQFEQLQQAGGQWHDWLILAQVAADDLGDTAQLPQRFAAHAERALRYFRRRIIQRM
jgi:CHAD domain-containing protein